MNVAFLGLGGNLGNRLENLAKASEALQQECGVILKISPIYETEAWGTRSEKKYLNQIIKLRTPLNAIQLLEKTRAVEAKLGRKRTQDPYADRKIDIDILFFNSDIIQLKHMQIPHPRLHLRKFVLAPMNDIDAKFIHPVLKKSIRSLLKNCPDNLEVKLIRDKKPLRYICIEGNIGSGKTTLAKALAKKFKARLVLEQFEENTLLPLFYSDPELYSFSLEFSFLINRFEQLHSAFKSSKKLVVSDYNINKCLRFAKINLSHKEFLLFRRQFQAFAAQLPEPDLVVYLASSLKNLAQNIKKRGRPYEQGISRSYLNLLDNEYKKDLRSPGELNILTIPVKRYHPALEAESIRFIENYIKENFGQTI